MQLRLWQVSCNNRKKMRDIRPLAYMLTVGCCFLNIYKQYDMKIFIISDREEMADIIKIWEIIQNYILKMICN